MTTLPLPTLAALLRASANGWYATEAATELLIAHDVWLRRSDFLEACVWVGITGTEPDQRIATIEWDRIPTFVAQAGCSDSERNILRLAAELAGVDTGVPLGELLTGLGEVNAGLVHVAVELVLTGSRR